MMNITRPLVSFIVPCYNLAHYLTECVASILAQSFTDFEVLIMDDCSPDDTPRVASAFTDNRVCYIRHETNLGHMQNYNVGIERARGKYVWVISADDRLRSREILKRFVDILEADDSVTFAFCPGLTLTSDGREGGPTGRVYPCDRIVSSDEFVKRAIQENPVCTPGALARRRCYTDMGLFATDLMFTGDWLAWCVFGLSGKVAYLEEPMVNYRLHGGSNTSIYRRDRAELITHDEIEVRWRVNALARHGNRADLVAACREAMAHDYARRLFASRTQSAFGMSLDEFERSVASHADRTADAAAIRSRVFELLGDEYQERGQIAEAKVWYASSRQASPRRAVTMKHVLSRCGGPGLRGRNALSAAKRRISRVSPDHGDPIRRAPVSPHSWPPLVSVIIPCYNTAHFLRAALESALNQTYGAKEIILVNDGSTDNFEQVVSPYRGRVKVIDQANAGLSAARNRALEHSSGDLIAYLDADDQWQPSKLEHQVRVLTERPDLAFVHTGIQFVDELDRPVTVADYRREFARGSCLAQLATQNSVIVSSVVHTRSALGSDRFEPHITAAGDWDLWLRLAARGPVAYLEAPLTLYRRHANNMSTQKRLMVTDSLRVIANALKRTRDRGVRRNLVRTRAELYRTLAHIEYNAGDLGVARQLFWGGLPWLGRTDLIRLATSTVGLSRTRLVDVFEKFRSSEK